MKRITLNSCMVALAAAVTAASAQTMSLVPRGGTGNSISVAPGDEVIIDVFAQDVAPSELRAYQATLPVSASGDGTGTVDHDGNVPVIDAGNVDYVFSALNAQGIGSIEGAPLITNALQLAADSVAVSAPKYLGEFRYNVSLTASGTFTIDVVNPGTNPATSASFLVDRNDAPLSFSTAPAEIQIAPSIVLIGQDGSGPSPAGFGDSDITVSPGGTIIVEAFIHATMPEAVRAYQVAFPTAASGGTAGSVTHDGALPTIDTVRGDYVFSGLGANGIVSLDPVPLAVNSLNVEGDSVVTTTGLYAAHATYTVSLDAEGEFTIDVVSPGENSATDLSFIVLADGGSPSPAAVPAALKTRRLLVTVDATPTCVDETDCNDSDACTRDRCNAGVCSNDNSFFYGDVDGSGGQADIFDILCVLDGFGGTFTPTCTKQDLDINPCAGDNDISIFDILAVLDAFGGVNACGCPAGP